MNNIDILEELVNGFDNLISYKQKQAIETLIVENKELKEFKENIEKIDRKQLDKLYEDAQKALKEYRETQNKVAKLEEENKELKEEIEELKEDRDKFKKALGKRITYCNELEKDLFENCSNYVIPKSKVKEEIKKLKQNVEEFEQYWSKDPRNFKKSDCVDYYKLEALQSLLGKE